MNVLLLANDLVAPPSPSSLVSLLVRRDLPHAFPLKLTEHARRGCVMVVMQSELILSDRKELILILVTRRVPMELYIARLTEPISLFSPRPFLWKLLLQHWRTLTPLLWHAKQRFLGSPQMFPKKALLTVGHRKATHGPNVLVPSLPMKLGRCNRSPTLDVHTNALPTPVQQKGPTLKRLCVLNSLRPPPL